MILDLTITPAWCFDNIYNSLYQKPSATTYLIQLTTVKKIDLYGFRGTALIFGFKIISNIVGRILIHCLKNVILSWKRYPLG